MATQSTWGKQRLIARKDKVGLINDSECSQLRFIFGNTNQ